MRARAGVDPSLVPVTYPPRSAAVALLRPDRSSHGLARLSSKFWYSFGSDTWHRHHPPFRHNRGMFGVVAAELADSSTPSANFMRRSYMGLHARLPSSPARNLSVRPGWAHRWLAVVKIGTRYPAGEEAGWSK